MNAIELGKTVKRIASDYEPETIAHGICDACGREVDNLLVINSAPFAGVCVCNPECVTEPLPNVPDQRPGAKTQD